MKYQHAGPRVILMKQCHISRDTSSSEYYNKLHVLNITENILYERILIHVESVNLIKFRRGFEYIKSLHASRTGIFQ
jgi:hypothetical protein